MSAISNLNPAPLEAPQRQAPVPPPPPVTRRPSRWRIGLLVLLIAGAAWLAYRFAVQPANRTPAAPAATIRTAKVTIGPVRRVVRMTGTTSARNFANVTAPMMRGPDSGRSLVLIYLTKSGGFVKQGEVVAQIDAQSMKDHVADIQEQVQEADSDVRKRIAEQAIDRETLRQTLRAAQADLDKAKLDASASEIRTPIDVELLKLSVEEAEARYKQLQEDVATQDQSFKAEIRILELTRDLHARHRDRHKTDIERFTVHAPLSGLAVMQSIWRGMEFGQVQQGDQVSPGQPFMKIVDTASMQVETTVSQVSSDQLRLGLPAVVHFDAFPDLHLDGKVRAIGAIATGGWRQNYYLRSVPVMISISGQDRRVIPDLSASADVVLEQQQNVTRVPLEAVFDKAGRRFVYVKQGDRFETRPVKLGMSDGVRAAVLEGLRDGEEVALERPASAMATAAN